MQVEQNTQNDTPFPDWIPPRPEMSPLAQFGMLLALTGAGLVLAGIVQLVIMMAGIKDLSFTDVESVMLAPKNAFIVQLSQIAASICLFVLPAFIFTKVSGKKFSSYYKFNGKSHGRLWMLTIGIALTGILVSEGLGLINEAIPLSHHLESYFKHLEDNYANQMSAMVKLNNPSEYLVAIFIVAFLPAICEELFFRGALQQIMVSWTRSAFWGIVITSAVFSAIHFSYYGFLSRFFLGITLGYIFYYGRNIWLNILVHFLNNALAITFMYIQLHQQHKPLKEVMNSASGLDFYYIIIAATIFAYLFRRFKKTCDLERTQIHG